MEPVGPVGEWSLDELQVEPGDAVRWQRKASGHWQLGTVIRREADGSVAVHDEDGAWRSLPVDRLEARCAGRRGWERLGDRVGRPAQMNLWS